jgi:hypothetical protein
VVELTGGRAARPAARCRLRCAAAGA